MYSLTNGTSRETDGDWPDGVDYCAAMELKGRIFKARSDAKMTQDDLAKAVGKTRSAVAQWESGDVRPRHKTIVDIAGATGKSLFWLLNGGEEGTAEAGLRVVGEVAAGLWLEASIDFEGARLTGPKMPVAADPDYPSHAQRLYRVKGTSINRVANEGEYLHAVDIHLADLKPENGDLVIVRRLRHGLAEYTAKQLVFVEGEWHLRPESYDSEWQSDLPLDADDGTEIAVTDIVIGKWAPIARRRPISKSEVDPFR